MTKLYLAGPMQNRPKFNFPLFEEAAEVLRAKGFDILSPAELDREQGDTVAEALASDDGDITKLTSTWGDFLSRDVKIVADEVGGIVFLPEWEESKGARLEAYVALACGHDEFWHYIPAIKTAKGLSRERVVEGVRGNIS